MIASRILLRTLACAVLFLLPAGAPGAQEDQAAVPNEGAAREGDVVVDVEIRGKAQVSIDRIRDNLKTRPGTVFSEEVLSEDIKMLYENEAFRILAVRREVLKVPGGVKVVLHIRQDDRVTGVRFQGLVSEDEEDLRKILGLREESVISPYVLTNYGDVIRDHYRNKGFYLAEVNVWLEPSEKGMVAVFEVFEGEKVTVDGIEFVGLESLDPDDLEKRMDTSTPVLGIFTTKLKADVLQKDIVKLNEYVRGEGFLDAKVSLEDVRLDEDRDDAVVVIRVQEGLRYTIGKISLEFGMWRNGTWRNPTESAEFSREEILALVQTEEGEFYRKTRIERDIRRIEKHYGDRGYIRASVLQPVAEDYHETEPVVDLTLWVVEAKKKYVRDVIVAGNTLTKDKVVRREITLYPGDVFKKSELEWSKGKLNSLQFFVNEQGQPRVFAEPRETEDDDYEDLYVEVEEGKTGFFFFTLGASTDGGLFGGVRIQKRNFDYTDTPDSLLSAPIDFFTHDAFHGGGQSLQLSAMPGTVYSNYELYFHEPYFLDKPPRPISLSFSAYHRTTDYTEYDVRREGIAPTLGKRLSREWSASVGFRNEQITMDEITDDAPLEAKELEGKTGSRSIETSLRYRKVDNLYDPKKGFAAGLAYEYTGGVLGNDLEMNRIVLDSKIHVPVLETSGGKTHILILSGATGWCREQGSMEDVPIFERFFVGGSSGRFPLRGFSWREIGPRQEDEPVGGKFAYAMSAEYMVPLYTYYDSYYDTETTIFRGVLFLDAGTVATDIHASDEIREMRSSCGVGLRITLPVFAGLPIALDYGIPIKKYPGDDRRSFSFSIQNWF